MSKFAALSIFVLADVASSQFMGYPYDYSSMFSGYTGYNPMMSMNSLGATSGFGAFGTGMESLYGQQTAFNAYNPYGNGMFNFGNNGLFGQTAFGNGFNTNLFGAGLTNGLNVQQPQQQQQQTFQQSPMLQGSQMSTLNNGNTMRAYGRRTENFNNNNNNNANSNMNYAPTRVGQTGCNGFGCQQGWQAKSKA